MSVAVAAAEPEHQQSTSWTEIWQRRLEGKQFEIYLTLPGPLKNCCNFFILCPIVKTLTPLESSQLSGSDDMYHYFTSQNLAVLYVL